MYVTYGSTNLSTLGGLTGTSQVSSYRREYQSNQRGGPDTIRVSAEVRGTICLVQSSTYTAQQAQTAINTAVDSLQSLLSTGGLDLNFRMDNGDATALSLPNSISLGGVQIEGLSIGTTGPADYATGLDWSFSASALYNDPNAEDLLDYQEAVQISGGAAQTEWTVVVDGPPLEWETASITVGTLIQSGTMTGRDANLILPASLSPAHYKANLSDAGTVRPLRREDGSVYAYTRSWRYVHQKAGPWDLPELGSV